MDFASKRKTMNWVVIKFNNLHALSDTVTYHRDLFLVTEKLSIGFVPFKKPIGIGKYV